MLRLHWRKRHELWENIAEKGNEQVWIPFHFLPALEGESETQQLICKKNSCLAQQLSSKLANVSIDDADFCFKLGIGLHALKGITLSVEEGQIVSLIGANGAGKTTTLRTISGLLRSKTGGITFFDKPLQKKSAEYIVCSGISHCPEGRRIFANMTVSENLEMGAFTRKDKKEVAATLKTVYEHFPRLKERMPVRS